MKNQIILYLTICLGTGIFLSEKLIPGTNLRIYFILLFFSLFISQLIKNHTIKIGTIGLQFILLGILIHNTPKYSVNKTLKTETKNKVFVLKVLENQKSSAKYLKYKVQNLANNTSGLLHIPFQENTFYPNDSLIIIANQYPLQSVKNPYQFDYAEFLNRKNITYTLYATKLLKHYSNHDSWQKIAVQSKERLRKNLQKAGFTQEARSIISSMLLGDRSEIKNDLNDSYIATGVIHILSISGLHVVMIYAILQFVLTPLTWIKNGRIMRIILSLIIIWIFAFYVELQPPVFRSALMITIYYLSEILKRPKNIYHTLALSAFVILLFEPNFLFDVGFQLSFSAVFFIVWLHPIYKNIYQPKHKFVQYFYDLSATSISAQMGTMPFSTLYFHQFSGLFLFGNLLLIPASFLMICGAIIAILLNILHLDFAIYTHIFNEFIRVCNAYIYWLSHFDGIIFKQVYISQWTAILLLLILFLIRFIVLQHSKIALFTCLMALITIQIHRYLDVNNIRNTNEIVIFHHYKGSIIGVRNGQDLAVFSSNNIDSAQVHSFVIRPYLIRNRIQNQAIYSLDSVVEHPHFYKSKHLLIAGNNRIFIGENMVKIPSSIDYILVRNSSFGPDKSDLLPPIKRVIADGSNYPSYISELKEILSKSSDSIVWNTSEKGYFILRF